MSTANSIGVSVGRILFLIALLFSAGSEAKGSSQERLFVVVPAISADEQAAQTVVVKAFKIPSRDYMCFRHGKRVKGDFRRRFAPYFSDSILESFFSGDERCALVGAARYGFMPLDDPSAWTDGRFKRVAISRPDIDGDRAIVEVRFWQEWNQDTDPTAQSHGGTVVYLVRERGNWRIDNLEGVELLGSNGFLSLVDDYPSVSEARWKDADYRRSLTKPQLP